MRSGFESDVLLSSAEVAEVIGVDPETISNWLRRGIISRSAIGGRQLRNRLFSIQEIYKTALKNELVKLGIQPSSAAIAINELWKQLSKTEIEDDLYAVLIATNSHWTCKLYRNETSSGYLLKLKNISAAHAEKGEPHPAAFAVIPISNIYRKISDKLSALLGEQQR